MKQNTEMINKIKNAIAVEYQLPGVSTLTEDNIDCNGNPFRMNVEIRSNKGVSCYVCRFDTQKDLFPYFQNKTGYKQNCDYIVFAENDICLYVFLVELKNTNVSPEKQLKISKPFAEFLVSRIEAVVGKSAKKVDYKMIGIKERAQFKRPTGIEKLYAFNNDGYLLLPRNDYMDLDFIITVNNL